MKGQRLDLNWFLLVAGAWVILVVTALWPASYWLQVDYVIVHDTVEGTPPRMSVSRTIKRPFLGSWLATVLERESGGFSAYCPAPGVNDYRPENVLPDDLDLNWWTFPKECDLPPGDYKVSTVWMIDPPLMPRKTIRVMSNVFTVHPKVQ